MTTTAPVKAAIKKMDKIIDEMETLVTGTGTG